ncbi:MAG: nickel pincer cofactor biosynthesis protein LarB [Pirellulales bacterium]
MQSPDARRLAEGLLAGKMSVDDFVEHLAAPGIANLGEAQVDLDRRRRCGFPEVVFAQDKTVESLRKIFQALLADGADVLATRVSPDQAAALLSTFPTGRYNPTGRTLRIPVGRTPLPGEQHGEQHGFVAVITAGTSDLPVAEEACDTVRWMGSRVILIQDVGVAGPQRLPARLHEFAHADAVVVVAGMEGALPSVVGGSVACPVIAVPTSVGYGASLGGLAALLGMLNSCAANVAVVNIDAGFKGGYLAGLIAHKAAQARGAKP